jgi:uncharacterized RDD family membrane protein YckC
LVKKPEEYALEYAGFWIRLGASAIDMVILGLFFLFLYYMFSDTIKSIQSSPVAILAMSTIVWFIEILYHAAFWSWRGQTPGKMILGIKIIRTDSSPVIWPHALLRYAGYIASAVPLFAGFFRIAFDKRKQGWHDKIADTYVVKLPVRQVIFTKSLAGGRVASA